MSEEDEKLKESPLKKFQDEIKEKKEPKLSEADSEAMGFEDRDK